MKQKQIVILTAIFVFLAFAIFLKSWVQSHDSAVQSIKAVENGPAFNFDLAKVEKILIGRGTVTPPVELVKTAGIWKIATLWNTQADAVKVKNLLEKIRTAKGEMRATGKNLFADFGIKDGDAFSVKFLGTGNSVLLDLRVGSKQAGTEGYFLRKASGDEIYLTDVNMADLLGIYTAFEEGKPLSDYWADLGLFNLQPDRVKKIIIHHFSNDQKIPITGLGLTPDKVDPKKTSWDFLRPELSSRLDPDKVIRFIATLNSIKGQKIMDPAGKGYGLEKPVTEIAVTEGDKEIVLSVGLKDKKEGFYYAKVSTSPSIFRINGYFFGDLDVDDARFFKESSPAKEGETHLPSQSGQFSTETLQKPKAA